MPSQVVVLVVSAALQNSRDDLCLSLLLTAGRTTAKSSAGAATR
jgi:hypothetical protein